MGFLPASAKSEIRLSDSLRYSIQDARAFSFMVGAGEAYLSAFVLAVGFSAITAGLITTIPVVVGSLVQVIIFLLYKNMASYRIWVICCAVIQSFTLFAIALMPFIHRPNLFVLYGLTCVYWSATLSAGPAWNAWMGSLVPKRLRVNFFAYRSRQVQIFTLLGLGSAGLLLHFSKQNNYQLHAFFLIFVLAGLARLLSATFIGFQLDVPKKSIEKIMEVQKVSFKLLANKEIIIILIYLFVLNFAVYISAPFYSPYMLNNLKLDYFSYMILLSTTFFARFMFYPFFQKMLHKLGPLKLIYFGTLLVSLLPFLWTLNSQFLYLFCLQVISGLGWGAQELGVFIFLLNKFSSEVRSYILTVVNVLNSFGLLLGSLLGSYWLYHSGVSEQSYLQVFQYSSLLRALPILLLPFLSAVRPIKIPTIFWRIVALRPNMGAVVRPILYTSQNNHENISSSSPNKAHKK